jgi:type IV secretion system protein VirB10
MAAPRNSADPRLGAPLPADEGVLPVVALPRQGLPRWALVGLAALAAILLFVVLDSRRRAITTPPETAPSPQAIASAPPPPLYVPPPPQVAAPPPIVVVPRTAAAPRVVVQPAPPPQIVYVPQPAAPVPEFVAPTPPARVTAEAALVVDNTAGQAAAAAGEAPAAAGAAQPSATGGGQAILGTRTRAGMLANRSTTVPQGTLIPATMETAFNSSRPGLARAIVARDVRGFDGSRVLIPRGSRLIGEYGAEVQQGQRRALINWVRLIRPDGVTIQIGSPATDPLGRGGVRASVNTHFFERFAGALLRSAVDVGIAVAAGASNTGLVLVPGAINASSPVQPREIPPTLTVRAGTSVSVFVARDLDFTGIERRRQ